MPSELKKAFQTGNGAGADNFPNYAPDLDGNFTLIESDIIALDARINAVIGPNAALPQTAVILNDLADLGLKNAGAIGEHSYKPSVSGSVLTLQPGACLGDGAELIATTLTNVVNSDGLATTTTHFISLDSNGVPSASVSANQGLVDIAKCDTDGGGTPDWDAATLVAAGEDQTAGLPTASIFLDGDEYANVLLRKAADAGSPFPDRQYLGLTGRIVAIERLLSGLITDPNGDATETDPGLGPPIMSIMTTTERNALTETDGMVLWNSTQSAFNFRVSSLWKRFPPAEMSDLDNAITFGVNVGPTAHGLAADPEEVWCYIKCQSAELGYVAEDRVFLVGGGVDPTDDTGVEVVVHETADTIEVVVGATGISILNLTTGVRTLITPGNWEISFGARSYFSAA